MKTVSARFFHELRRYEKLVYPALFLIFLVITIPGTAWGLPGLWHPDELVIQVERALKGKEFFDEITFTYPSLPKYVLYALGKVMYGLGYSTAVFVHAARIGSVLLGAVVVVLVYLLIRTMGGNPLTSLFGAALMLFSSELALNARFAHNDIYTTVFSSLAVLALVRYSISRNRLTLYLVFLLVGFAASSKYNAISFLIAPVAVYLWTERGNLRKEALRIGETLFIGLALTALGYAIGTPKALLWMAFYFKRVLPELIHHATYAREPGTVIGLVSQWSLLRASLGMAVFILFLVAFLWYSARPLRAYYRRSAGQVEGNRFTWILVLSIISLDLPMLVSYNQQSRFFLPLYPILSALIALFVEEILNLTRVKGLRNAQALIYAGSIGIVIISLLRVFSVALLFQNDARIPAGVYLRSLPENTSIEYTPYHPNIPPGHFARAHSYPIYFIKHINQPFPQGIGIYRYNQGISGLDRRKTDFLVIDSFTYSKFSDPFVCQLHSLECSFFQKLEAGQTPYQLMKTFHYGLPAFLPQLSEPFLNPEIQIYQRISSGG